MTRTRSTAPRAIPNLRRFTMGCKLVIADDLRLMVAAVRTALEDERDIEIVGETQAGHQLLPLVGRTSPDLVLLDLRMPGMDGLRCLELLGERYPEVKAIVLSGTDDPAAVDAAFARGAVAFIQKTIDPADLAAVIRQALAGDVYYAAGRAAAGLEAGQKVRQQLWRVDLDGHAHLTVHSRLERGRFTPPNRQKSYLRRVVPTYRCSVRRPILAGCRVRRTQIA